MEKEENPEKDLRKKFGNSYRPEAPEGYFGDFQKRLDERLQKEKKKITYPSWLKPAFATAIVAAIIIALIPFLKNDERENEMAEISDFPEEVTDQAEYLLSESTLTELVHSDSLFTDEEFIDDAAIEQYLIENRTDVSPYFQ